MSSAAVSYWRRYYFLLVVLLIGGVALYFALFSTQALSDRYYLRLFETYVSHQHQNGQHAAENNKWSEDPAAAADGRVPSQRLNDSSTKASSSDGPAAANDSSSSIEMMSTLFERLSSELEKRIRLLLPISNDNSSSRLKQCPMISPKLIGRARNISVAAILAEKDDVLQYDLMKSGVEVGGRYEPADCRARHQLALVIPIRNRTEHLAVFVRYMHRFLQRQQLSYAIFVVEQSQGSPFNRGMLMNIGFKEAQQLLTMREMQFQCFIFHDVDLLPEDDGNPYTCPEQGTARQMSYSLDYWDNYKPSPDWHFGGVTALTTADFQSVNGFSNLYWGWGGEDDDLLKRVRLHNVTVTRSLQDYPSLMHMVRYTSLSHAKAEPNPVRYQLLDQGPQRIASDGLTSLRYKTIDIQRKLLYTYIRVDIQQYPATASSSSSTHRANIISATNTTGGATAGG